MTNETEYKLGVNGKTSQTWRERFVGYLDNPGSDVFRMVERGRALGLVDGDLQGQRQLAGDFGSLFDAVYIPETGGEVYVDDLSPEEIETRTGISPDRQAGLIEIMVESGMVKSRVAVEARRKANRR